MLFDPTLRQPSERVALKPHFIFFVFFLGPPGFVADKLMTGDAHLLFIKISTVEILTVSRGQRRRRRRMRRVVKTKRADAIGKNFKHPWAIINSQFGTCFF